MADAVTTQTLEAGNNRLIMKFTNISDSTGETGVTKITLANYTNGSGAACTNLILDRIDATCSMGVKIFTDQSSNPVTIVLGVGQNSIDFLKHHGQGCIMGTSGSFTIVKFSTINAAANNTYDIVMSFRIC